MWTRYYSVPEHMHEWQCKLNYYSCMFANEINQLKAICVVWLFVFMVNFNMQFIGEVY